MNEITKYIPIGISLITAIATFMLVIATCVLAAITYGYIKETSEMRKIAYKTYQLDLSPKVFVDDIRTLRAIILDEKVIKVRATFLIKNYGKTEAENVVISYKYKYADTEPLEKQLKPAPYIFSQKSVNFEAVTFGIGLSKKGVAIAEKAKKQGKKINITKDFASPLFVTVHIKYFDHEKKEQSASGLFKYNWDKNSWDYTIADEEQAEDS